MIENSLEETVNQLVDLAHRKPLGGEDRKKAEALMIDLRQRGFTSEEISKLTGGAWSGPTIKLATRGTRPVDQTQKESIISAMGDFVRSGRSLEDLDRFVSLNKELQSAGLTFDYLISVLTEMSRQGIKTDNVINLLKDFEELNLGAEGILRVHSLSLEMQKEGITPEILAGIVEAVKIFKDPQLTLQAMRTYADLKTMEVELQRLRLNREKTLKENAALLQEEEKKREDLQNLDEELANGKSTLEELEKVKSLGFDSETLRDIQQLSKNYGGPKDLVLAMGEFNNLGGIRAKKDREQLELAKLEAEHVHLFPVIQMCERLIFEYHYSPESVDGVLKIAEKFGTPAEASDALMSFKDLKEIKSKTNESRREVSALEEKKTGLKQDVETLQARREQAYEFTTKAFVSFEERCNRAMASFEDRCQKALVNLTSKFREDAKEFGELKAEAGKLGEELVLAKFFLVARTFPDEMRKVPLKYIVPLVEVVRNVCAAKGFNPKVTPSDEVISEYYPINRFTEVGLVDLLKWALRGLLQEISKGAGEKGLKG